MSENKTCRHGFACDLNCVCCLQDKRIVSEQRIAELEAEIERLRAQLASTQYHIRRWQSGTQAVGVHRACECPVCETLYGVDADGPTDKQDDQLAAAKELLREILTENARMGNDVVLLTKKWRERAKEVGGQ